MSQAGGVTWEYDRARERLGSALDRLGVSGSAREELLGALADLEAASRNGAASMAAAIVNPLYQRMTEQRTQAEAQRAAWQEALAQSEARIARLEALTADLRDIIAQHRSTEVGRWPSE